MERTTTVISQADIDRHLDFCRHRPAAHAPLAFVDTYGCQQNEADSERIRGYLAQMGFGFTNDEEQARVIVINTCAIREHAEQRVFGNLGALVHTQAPAVRPFPRLVENAPAEPPKKVRSLPRLSLDSLASIGVLLMTLAFTLRILVF